MPMSHTFRKASFLIGVLMFVSSCATIITGSRQQIDVASKGESKAVYVNGEFNLIGGSFGCADGVKVSATKFNFGAPTSMEASCIANH